MLLVGGVPVAIASGVALIAALLVLEYRNIALRSVLATQLWEESDPAASNNALRQLLARLRRVEVKQGLSIVRSLRRHLVRDDRCVTTDIEAFLALGEDCSTEADLMRLLDLYRGDLLTGVDANGDLRIWLEAKRAQLREHFIRVVSRAATRFSGAVALRAQQRIAELTNGEERVLPSRAESGVAAETSSDHSMGVPVVALTMPQCGLAPEHQHISEALVVEVTVALQRLRPLRVIAPHSMLMLTQEPHAGQAKLLRCDYIVHSHAIQSGIEFSLLEKRTGVLLLSFVAGLIDGRLEKTVAHIATTVAARFADALALRILARASDAAERSPYVQYLSARRHLQSLDLRHIRRAKNELRHVVDVAPDFAPAWSLLAHAVSQEWTVLGGVDTTALRESERLAKRALSIDPNDAEALRQLARSARFLRGLEESISYFADAQALAPNHADLAADYADTCVHGSDLSTARRLLDHALVLNPIAPDDYLWTDGAIRFFEGDYHGALTSLRRMQVPETAARLVAAVAAMAGERDTARRYRNLELRQRPGFSIAAWLGVMPQRSADHARLYAAALERAGFPA